MPLGYPNHHPDQGQPKSGRHEQARILFMHEANAPPRLEIELVGLVGAGSANVEIDWLTR